ncbi:MAG: hypothetical protein R6V75_08315 [Bacteroidales bacterium]
MPTLISIIYYAFVAFIVVLIVYNLIRTRDWKKELIYIVILMPFLLRLLMLK